MSNSRSITIINDLVEINNDRILGYETAILETNEIDLKLLFSQCCRTSETFKVALRNEIEKHGGTATEGSKTAGKIYRMWMNLKSAIQS